MKFIYDNEQRDFAATLEKLLGAADTVGTARAWAADRRGGRRVRRSGSGTGCLGGQGCGWRCGDTSPRDWDCRCTARSVGMAEFDLSLWLVKVRALVTAWGTLRLPPAAGAQFLIRTDLNRLTPSTGHVLCEAWTRERPLRLAIVDDYAVVIAGVASFLADERIDVVETGASLPVVSDVDIVLYDTFGQVTGDGIDLEDYVRDGGAKVVIYSWNLEPGLIEQAMAGGASGYLSKVLTGPVIVKALERIMSGETVIMTGEHETSVGGAGDWPGRSVGLSPREAEVLALIAHGLSNQEIAERAYVARTRSRPTSDRPTGRSASSAHPGSHLGPGQRVPAQPEPQHRP